jgi:23S rRNA (guanosine2251-2'-O)-methyltransferase
MSLSENNVIGIHAITELIHQQPDSIQHLIVLAGRLDKRLGKILEKASELQIPIDELSRKEMDQRFAGVHQGVVAICSFRSSSKSEKDLVGILDELAQPPLLLVLDGITDPHNFGACLRTADAVGVDAVIVPKDKSAPLNATVRKVASGAAESINLVTVTNLARCLQLLKERGIWLVGTADEAEENLFELDLTGPIALVMGSEGSGLRRLTRDYCDFVVAIPMAGSVSSLNVSVATGVALFEASRQRSAAKLLK